MHSYQKSMRSCNRPSSKFIYLHFLAGSVLTWHGPLDLVLHSKNHDGDAVAISKVIKEEEEEVSPHPGINVEVKTSSTKLSARRIPVDDFDQSIYEIDPQFVSQALTFGQLQKSRHDNFCGFAITLALSPQVFQIFIYNPEEDVLLASRCLEFNKEETLINKTDIFMLFLILNHVESFKTKIELLDVLKYNESYFGKIFIDMNGYQRAHSLKTGLDLNSNSLYSGLASYQSSVKLASDSSFVLAPNQSGVSPPKKKQKSFVLAPNQSSDDGPPRKKQKKKKKHDN